MGDADIDLSHGVVILSDRGLGSYTIIGDLLAATFIRDGIAVNSAYSIRAIPPHSRGYRHRGPSFTTRLGRASCPCR